MASLVQPGLSGFLPAWPRRSPALAREGAALRDLDRGIAIELSAAEKSFGERRVLHPIDLRIEPGSFVAVVGRSGSGKSTLLRLLGGLDRPGAGAVMLDGNPAHEAAGAVRIMFQEGRLLPWRRVIDNVRLGLEADHRTRAQEALAAVGLADRAGDWPRVLSGGQKQRVALARALASQPRLILLDEPLGALDALTRLDMQALIERIWRNTGFTAVLVTHDVAEAAALADRILLIEDGNIALDLNIDLPRPRRPTAALADIEAHVLGRILGAG